MTATIRSTAATLNTIIFAIAQKVGGTVVQNDMDGNRVHVAGMVIVARSEHTGKNRVRVSAFPNVDGQALLHYSYRPTLGSMTADMGRDADKIAADAFRKIYEPALAPIAELAQKVADHRAAGNRLAQAMERMRSTIPGAKVHEPRTEQDLSTGFNIEQNGMSLYGDLHADGTVSNLRSFGMTLDKLAAMIAA